MTLKEKLEVEIMDLPIMEETIDAIGKDLEYVADDFAIGFAEWIDFNYYQHKYDNNKYAMSEEDFTSGTTYKIKELLQIYKKVQKL